MERRAEGKLELSPGPDHHVLFRSNVMATRAIGPSAPAENPTLRRADVEAAVERLVDMFDATEGDPDLELNGDELDGTGAEDDFCDHIVPGHLQGPGCRPSAALFL
jgi:hypothetical protein